MALAIVILYFAAMVALGLLSRVKAKSITGFFVLNRSGSIVFIAGSLFATIVGGSATIGMAGLGFSRGLTGAWWLLVGAIGLILLGLFLAKTVRKLGIITLPQLVEKQYDSRAALAAAVLIVVAWVGIIAGQIIAAGKIMSVLTIGTPAFWMVIFTVVFVAYTAIGGQYAVITTDVVQAIIIAVGIIPAFFIAISRVGGLDGLATLLPADYLSFPLSAKFDIRALIILLIMVGSTYLVGPDMYTRLFCARDEKVARNSVFWTAGLLIPMALMITVIGMTARILFPQITAEQSFPTMITQVLPPFIGAIVLAALLAAVMSSADTCILSASGILTLDVIKRLQPKLDERRTLQLTKVIIVVLGVASLIVALILKGVISALLFAYTIYTSGLILPILFGFYREKLKITGSGALAAIIGGGLIALTGKIINQPYWDLAGFIASGVLLVLVSLVGNWIRKPSAGLKEPGSG